jgi:hypothetical protein
LKRFASITGFEAPAEEADAGSALASRLRYVLSLATETSVVGLLNLKNLEIRIRANQVRFDPIAIGDVHIMTQIIELKFVHLHFFFFRVCDYPKVSFFFI